MTKLINFNDELLKSKNFLPHSQSIQSGKGFNKTAKLGRTMISGCIDNIKWMIFSVFLAIRKFYV